MRIDEAAIFRHGAESIGITVGRHSCLAVFMYHGLLQHGDVRLNRLRIDSGKQRIQLSANFDDG